MTEDRRIETAFQAAEETFAEWGVDVRKALDRLDRVEISMHCWQGDDVAGLESGGAGASGGILSTGNYPYRPANGDELRMDIEEALRLLPGPQRVNLHASYAETGAERPDRDGYRTGHFARWMDWAASIGVRLDFNPTSFGHPKASDDLTLSHPDPGVRAFWIDHFRACRAIAADIGRRQGNACVVNHWVQDGMKDLTPNRYAFRERLRDSLDAVLAERYPGTLVQDAVECKLFGIGVESFTAGSHEFYMGYLGHAREQGNGTLMLTLDMGHFHPTETIADKIPSLLLYSPKLLVHVSRGVRWDSDFVVITEDPLAEAMKEIARIPPSGYGDGFDRVRLATDFFDGSINRIGAWTIGVRATRKAVLAALLEPTDRLRALEADRDYAGRLALMDGLRTAPVGAVWDQYCLSRGVPPGVRYMEEIARYEREVLAKR
ncbi:MAG: L-rhamnose isomerase [Clostridia bacterium]|nr:L-rhamnose isomerase [Clostridia bacterium]